jgi:Fic family protein
MSSPVRKGPRRAVLDDAGRAWTLSRRLAELREERDRLDQKIRRLEREEAEATSRFDASYQRALDTAGSDRNAFEDGQAERSLSAGKLPHRVLMQMRAEPDRLYTAASLQHKLGVEDVQQVRTALARLVAKGLIRRTDVKGEFAI